MKFVTNRIRTGKAKSFDDIINEYRKTKEVKTASTETVVKTAEKDEADSSGQLDVEPLHQTGESTTMPKNGPNAKKEGTEKGTAKTSTDPEAEGKDSGQPKAEGSEKFTNEPKVEEDAKGGSAKEETKVAEAKCEECGKVCTECTCEKCECKACKEEKIKIAAELTPAQEKLPDFIKEKIEGKGKKEDKDDKDKKDDKDEDKEAKVKEDDKEEKEAKTEDKEEKEKEKEAKVDKDEKKEEEKEAGNKKQFVKLASLDGNNLVKTMICLADQAVKSIGKEAAVHYLNSLFGELKFANLNAKNKEFLRTYWTKLFGEDYVNALLADK